MKRADTNPSVSTALDQERRMFYNAQWQLIEEHIDDDCINSPGLNRIMDYVWGLRYIDDIVMRRLDGNADFDFDDGATDPTYYHCTDAQFSTVAVLSDTAALLERVSYDPYGRARHHKPADCGNGEGDVNVTDQLLVISTWGSVPEKGDINRDGAVNVTDLMAVIGQWGSGLASGRLSLTDNVIGWDGYVFNAEIDDDGMYTVRFRHYRPGIGRWLERDIKLNDGLNLYQFSRSTPRVFIDPDGREIRFGHSDDEDYFLQLARKVCPEGDWVINDPWGENNRRLASKVKNFCNDYDEDQGFGCQRKPPIRRSRKANDAKRPSICGCLCDAQTSATVFRLFHKNVPAGWPPGFNSPAYNMRTGELYLPDGSFPASGTYPNPSDRPASVKIGEVLSSADIILLHELCCHAVAQMSHPKDATAYTSADPVIQCENKLRTELGPEYGVAQ